LPRFTNLDGSRNPHGLHTVLRWKLGLHDGRKISAPGVADVPRVVNDGAALRGAPHDALTWIGHATYLVQLGGTSCGHTCRSVPLETRRGRRASRRRRRRVGELSLRFAIDSPALAAAVDRVRVR